MHMVAVRTGGVLVGGRFCVLLLFLLYLMKGAGTCGLERVDDQSKLSGDSITYLFRSSRHFL